MKSVLAIIAFALYSSTTFAVPPASAPTLVGILPTQKAYIEAMSQLNPTGDVSIAFFQTYDLPASLRNGTCSPVLMSRGGSMVKVTVPVAGGEVVMYFGDLENDPNYPVRCI